MGHTYAFADLHGCWESYQQILDFIKPDDKVYCLGDCGDRGEDGIKIIESVLSDPRFIYIKGNHEDMLCNLIQTYINMKNANPFSEEGDILFNLYYTEEYALVHYNGGAKTFEDWLDSPNQRKIWNGLKSLPFIQTYLNQKGEVVILSHAGFTPHLEKEPTEKDCLWNRYHFNQLWDSDYSKSIIVHGHTPIPYMDEFLNNWKEIDPGPLWYCDGHKVDIDCGTVFTGITTLLDLDTWESHTFIDEKEWIT